MTGRHPGPQAGPWRRPAGRGPCSGCPGARRTQVFEFAAHDAGLPPIRFHDLRHSAASLAFAAGGDIKAVQAMLRHNSVAITADTYTEVMREVGAELA